MGYRWRYPELPPKDTVTRIMETNLSSRARKKDGRASDCVTDRSVWQQFVPFMISGINLWERERKTGYQVLGRVWSGWRRTSWYRYNSFLVITVTMAPRNPTIGPRAVQTHTDTKPWANTHSSHATIHTKLERTHLCFTWGRSTKPIVFIQWNVIQQYKGVNSWYPAQQKGTKMCSCKWKKIRLRGQCPMSFYFYGGLLTATVWRQEQLCGFHELGPELFEKIQEGILCGNGTVTCLGYGSVG